MNSFPSILESINDLNIFQIKELISETSYFKSNEQTEHLLLPNSHRPIVTTSFLENSTRTKHSFAIAINRLGATYIDFNAEKSSLQKGESLEETFLTLYNQGVDLCIIRSSTSNLLSEFKINPPIKLINGGDGINEHPTQALLDLYTLLEICPDLEGRTLAIFGDNIHSRVAHSLIKILPLFKMKVILCGPKAFLPAINDLPPGIELSESRDEVIKKSDFLYLLRIQKERHDSNMSENFHDYHHEYGVSLALLKKMNALKPILHPGPVNIGVELDQDLLKSNLFLGYKQVQNSVPMRMAIIKAMLINSDENIGKIYGEKV